MGNTGGQNLKIQGEAIPRDWTAFCEFIEANYRVMYTVALAHVRDAETAQEITQDVCVRLLLKRDQVPAVANMSGWLARVARNTAIDWIRRRQTHSRILATMESWNHNPATGNPAPQDARTAAIMEEEKQRLYKALEHIAPEDREMLLMHYLDGVDKQDIARLLEVHPSTVGRRIDKALGELKKSMTEFEPARLRSLRPAEHSSRGVLATLGVVAALGAAEKAALAAVAAPLPVLSVGGVAAAASHTGLVSRLLTSLTRNGQYGLRLWLGCAAVVLVAVTLTHNLPSKRDHKQIKGGIDLSSSALKTARDQPIRRHVNGRQRAEYLQRGVTADGVKVLGYLPVNTTHTTTLHGKVVDAGGSGIPRAAVTAWIGNTTSHTVKTSQDGSFVFEALEEGTAILTAESKGYATTAWGEFMALLPMPGLDDRFTIELEDSLDLAGKVVNESGEPLPGTTVTVVKQFDRQKQIYNGDVDYLKHSSYWKGPLPQQTVLADEDGKFSLTGLKAGYVSLHVESSSRPDIIAEEIETGADDVVVVLDQGIAVEGSVFDGTTPLAGVPVTIKDGVEAFTGITGKGATAVTDDAGRFVVQGLQVRRTDLAEWSFTASAETTSPVKIPKYLFSVSRGEGTCTLEMNSADAGKVVSWSDAVDVRRFYGSRTQPKQFGSARLVGTVDLPAEVQGEAMIEISSKVLIDKQPLVEGKFTFEKLPADEYEVRCRFDKVATAGPRLVVVPQRIEIREGQLHTIHLKPGSCVLSGKVVDNDGSGMDGNVSVSATEKLSPFYGPTYNAGYIAQVNVPASGEFAFNGILPGKYELKFSRTGYTSSQVVECRAGDSNYYEIRPQKLLRVRGKIVSGDGKPANGIRIAFEAEAAGAASKSARSAAVESDNYGNFETDLSTGSYTMLVQPRERIFPERVDVEVREGQTTIPTVTLNRQHASGIIVKQTGIGTELWRTAKFDLVRKESGDRPAKVISVYPVSKTNDSVTLSGIEPGDYELVVRSSQLDGWPQHPDINELEMFSSVSVPHVKVTEGEFAIVLLPLEKGRPVSFACYPGEHQLTWVAPGFWIKDGAGAKMMVKPERLDLALKLGLAPGKYYFGVTLDYGQEHSVAFEIPPTKQLTEVLLHLP